MRCRLRQHHGREVRERPGVLLLLPGPLARLAARPPVSPASCSNVLFLAGLLYRLRNMRSYVGPPPDRPVQVRQRVHGERPDAALRQPQRQGRQPRGHLPPQPVARARQRSDRRRVRARGRHSVGRKRSRGRRLREHHLRPPRHARLNAPEDAHGHRVEDWRRGYGLLERPQQPVRPRPPPRLPRVAR